MQGKKTTIIIQLKLLHNYFLILFPNCHLFSWCYTHPPTAHLGPKVDSFILIWGCSLLEFFVRRNMVFVLMALPHSYKMGFFFPLVPAPLTLLYTVSSRALDFRDIF